MSLENQTQSPFFDDDAWDDYDDDDDYIESNQEIQTETYNSKSNLNTKNRRDYDEYDRGSGERDLEQRKFRSGGYGSSYSSKNNGGSEYHSGGSRYLKEKNYRVSGYFHGKKYGFGGKGSGNYNTHDSYNQRNDKYERERDRDNYRRKDDYNNAYEKKTSNYKNSYHRNEKGYRNTNGYKFDKFNREKETRDFRDRDFNRTARDIREREIEINNFDGNLQFKGNNNHIKNDREKERFVEKKYDKPVEDFVNKNDFFTRKSNNFGGNKYNKGRERKEYERRNDKRESNKGHGEFYKNQTFSRPGLKEINRAEEEVKKPMFFNSKKENINNDTKSQLMEIQSGIQQLTIGNNIKRNLILSDLVLVDKINEYKEMKFKEFCIQCELQKYGELNTNAKPYQPKKKNTKNSVISNNNSNKDINNNIMNGCMTYSGNSIPNIMENDDDKNIANTEISNGSSGQINGDFKFNYYNNYDNGGGQMQFKPHQ